MTIACSGGFEFALVRLGRGVLCGEERSGRFLRGCMVAKTKDDARFLFAMGIVDDDAVGLLQFSEAEWRYLVAQLRQDVDAAVRDLERSERLYGALTVAYQRLDDEAAAAHRRVRELESGGWRRVWGWLRSGPKVTV